MARHGWMFLCVLAACGDDGGPPTVEGCEGTPYRPWVETVAFADLPLLHPIVETSLLPDVHLTLDFGDRFITGKPTPIFNGEHAYCPLVEDSFTATLDGIAGEVANGGWSCAGPGGMVCSAPSVTFTLAADHHPLAAQLVISDSAQSLTLPLGDVLVERTMERVGQTDWTLQASQPVTIRWSSASDLTTLDLRAGFSLSNATPARGWGVDANEITIVDDTITFTVPDDPDTGPGRFYVYLDGTITYPTHEVRVSHSSFQDATFAP